MDLTCCLFEQNSCGRCYIIIFVMEMFREAFICGLGMIMDISGSHYANAQPPTRTESEAIASDWRQVGGFVTTSLNKERPQIKAEIAKQLQLKL